MVALVSLLIIHKSTDSKSLNIEQVRGDPPSGSAEITGIPEGGTLEVHVLNCDYKFIQYLQVKCFLSYMLNTNFVIKLAHMALLNWCTFRDVCHKTPKLKTRSSLISYFLIR